MPKQQRHSTDKLGQGDYHAWDCLWESFRFSLQQSAESQADEGQRLQQQQGLAYRKGPGLVVSFLASRCCSSRCPSVQLLQLAKVHRSRFVVRLACRRTYAPALPPLATVEPTRTSGCPSGVNAKRPVLTLYRRAAVAQHF